MKNKMDKNSNQKYTHGIFYTFYISMKRRLFFSFTFHPKKKKDGEYKNMGKLTKRDNMFHYLFWQQNIKFDSPEADRNKD